MIPRIGLIPSYEDCDINKPKPSEGVIDAVQRAGGELVVIDSSMPDDQLIELIDGLDGFILQGGGDLDPAYYGEPRNAHCGPAIPERDALELFCLEHVFARDLPLLTICRGTQVLNVFCGGSLYQDLPSECGVQHNLGTGMEIHQDHMVRMTPGSLAQKIAGCDEMPTNSSHHQSVKRLGSGLCVTAMCGDVVEAIERPASRFVLGLQWHPECSRDQDDASMRYFQALIDACKP